MATGRIFGGLFSAARRTAPKLGRAIVHAAGEEAANQLMFGDKAGRTPGPKSLVEAVAGGIVTVTFKKFPEILGVSAATDHLSKDHVLEQANSVSNPRFEIKEFIDSKNQLLELHSGKHSTDRDI